MYCFDKFRDENSETVCSVEDINQKFMLSLLDMVCATLLPFCVMFLFTILLIYTILKSRFRILNLSTQRDRYRLRKDIKLAVSSVLFNLLFVILNLPHSIYHLLFTNFTTDLHDALYYFSLISFCINY